LLAEIQAGKKLRNIPAPTETSRREEKKKQPMDPMSAMYVTILTSLKLRHFHYPLSEENMCTLYLHDHMKSL
jgi:hypothetical protein